MRTRLRTATLQGSSRTVLVLFDIDHGHAWDIPQGIVLCVASGVVLSFATCHAPRSAWRPPPTGGRGSAVVPSHANIHQ